MGVWARAVLGAIGLLSFGALALGDARALRRRSGVPVAWVLTATAATVVAGLVHLALTPEHWDQSRLYGIFFLLAGLSQLALASLLGRPAAWPWTVSACANLFLVGVYVTVRVAPRGEEIDALGLCTVGAELVAAAVAVLASRRSSDEARLRRSR